MYQKIVSIATLRVYMVGKLRHIEKRIKSGGKRGTRYLNLRGAHLSIKGLKSLIIEDK